MRARPVWLVDDGNRAVGDGGGRSLATVLNYLRLFDRYKPAFHHFIEYGRQCIDLLFAVDDLDNNRKILGNGKEMPSVQPAGSSEPRGCLVRRRTSKSAYIVMKDPAKRDAVGLVIYGSPDVRQIDGLA
jgi:hypothetical protein